MPTIDAHRQIPKVIIKRITLTIIINMTEHLHKGISPMTYEPCAVLHNITKVNYSWTHKHTKHIEV